VKDIYFDPQDVEVCVVDGRRYFQVAWWKTCAWHAPGALKLALRDATAGWQLAREAHRKIEIDVWYRRVYPIHAADNDAFSAHTKAGGSVTSFSRMIAERRRAYDSGL
jgi:hypothetical protein